MLEEKIEALIGALEANTEALLAGGGSTKEKPAGESTAAKPTSKKKSSKKKSRRNKPAETTVTIEEVKEHLVVLDRESAKAVLAKFKVQKLSDLAPEDFEAAIVEADSYVAEPESEEDDGLFD